MEELSFLLWKRKLSETQLFNGLQYKAELTIYQAEIIGAINSRHVGKIKKVILQIKRDSVEGIFKV